MTAARSPLKLSLDLSALTLQDRLAWMDYVGFAVAAVRREALITIDVSLSESRAEYSGRNPEEARRSVSESRMPVAFVAGAAALSRKILRTFEYVHVAPISRPREIDSFIYWTMVIERETAPTWMLETLRPTPRRVTLLTSVFDGDEFLAGFLDNMGGLEGYGECEHLLIRAGSPGREEEALVRYIRTQPGAVYIDLHHDPGLYAVWNLGVRLATGRYLSSANLDDRRAPPQIRRLARDLDERPEVDVVSSALRVSERRNLSWQASSECRVMFGEDPDRTYVAGELVQQGSDGRRRSRNLPHCMPLWRRTLHAIDGYFDEGRYGPSADWEFWLRAGSRGARFRFIQEPLGLYLKDSGSYWHRHAGNGHADTQILKEYGALVKAEGAVDRRSQRPLGSRLNEAIALLHDSAYLEGIVGLLRCAEEIQVDGSEAQRRLLSAAGRMYLARDDLADSCAEAGWSGGEMERLFDRLITLVHGIGERPDAGGSGKARETLLMACADLEEATTDRRAGFLRALVLRKFGERDAEARLLARLHEDGPVPFWSGLQAVYRFEVGLKELTGVVSRVHVARPEDLQRYADLNLVYYPAYSGNTYHRLLYRPVGEGGASVRGIRAARDLRDVLPKPGARNVLHIHWVNGILKQPNPGGVAGRAREFLGQLRLVQSRGFQVYWTVHNNLSHEMSDRDEEIAFRRALFELADRVYLHHPMAAELLEWLPGRDKLHLVEHGSYEPAVAPVDREEARRRLGLAADDFVLGVIGQIRDYKGLEETLPRVFAVMERNPGMRLVVAGRIVADAVGAMLRDQPPERVIFRGEHLPVEELETCMRACDYGLLSYRDIVTSGALFHWASCGIPVIAPALGTIPAYVVDGWNGYLYGRESPLEGVIEQCVTAPLHASLTLGRNVKAMADGLRWEFF